MTILKKTASWMGLVIILSIAVTIFWRTGPGKPRLPRDEVVIALPGTPPPALIFIADDLGFFAEEGLAVRFSPHGSGKVALAAVMNEGADPGATPENPIMHTAMRGDPSRRHETGQVGGGNRHPLTVARKGDESPCEPAHA